MIPYSLYLAYNVYCCCSFGHGSSLLWTHALRPFYNRPIALTQERLMICASVCVTEG